MGWSRPAIRDRNCCGISAVRAHSPTPPPPGSPIWAGPGLWCPLKLQEPVCDPHAPKNTHSRSLSATTPTILGEKPAEVSHGHRKKGKNFSGSLPE
ncbi:unnamed protein product [Caretta caretta]